jgi:hypothetical protein
VQKRAFTVRPRRLRRGRPLGVRGRKRPLMGDGGSRRLSRQNRESTKEGAARRVADRPGLAAGYSTGVEKISDFEVFCA